MISNERLELLSLANKFKVTDRGEGRFEVEYHYCNDGYPLSAFIDDDGIEYCVGGVYNNGCDYADIDIKALGELVKFCKMITEEGNNEQTL